jgi:hypothetical protein
MESKYSKVELLAFIKNYNKNNSDKIKNVDKLKKDELQDLCIKYNIISTESDQTVVIDLRNVSKKDLLRDLELFYLKQNKCIPDNVRCMKKNELIDFMELNGIQHYNIDALKAELEKYQKFNTLKNIIIFNIIKYDNIDINSLDNDALEEFIKNNNLDTNIEHFQAYCILLHTLYNAFDKFCKDTGMPYEMDKIKSLPKITQILSSISAL